MAEHSDSLCLRRAARSMMMKYGGAPEATICPDDVKLISRPRQRAVSAPELRRLERPVRVSGARYRAAEDRSAQK